MDLFKLAQSDKNYTFDKDIGGYVIKSAETKEPWYKKEEDCQGIWVPYKGRKYKALVIYPNGEVEIGNEDTGENWVIEIE